MAPGDNVESAANGVDYYPPPLTTHAVVVNDPAIFMKTLQVFHHATIGMKFVIPAVDGKPLNLHLLYVEVTKRGGYEEVIALRNWTSVSSKFMFSPRTTNAAFALKKHYSRLLYHYEQVYFFRVSDIGEPSINSVFEIGESSTINSDIGEPSTISVFEIGESSTMNSDIGEPSAITSPESLMLTGSDESLMLTSNDETHMFADNVESNMLNNEINMLADNNEESVITCKDGSLILNCVVEDKLDIGKLISIEKDNEIFYTIIFNPIIPTIPNPQPSLVQSTTTTSAPPTNPASTFATTPPSSIVVALPTNVASETPTANTTPSEHNTMASSLTRTTQLDIPGTSELRPQAPKSKGKRSQGDPNRPKRPKSAYTFFVSRKRTELKSAYPKAGSFTITKKISKVWSRMHKNDKKIFKQMAKEDSERYKREKQEYEEKNKRA